jgi:hypothetical protein
MYRELPRILQVIFFGYLNASQKIDTLSLTVGKIAARRESIGILISKLYELSDNAEEQGSYLKILFIMYTLVFEKRYNTLTLRSSR